MNRDDPVDDPPPLDAAFEGGTSRERIYSALVQTRSPAGARDIAEWADCHPDTARDHLDWFTELGIATRHAGRPTTYERNEAYFEWRYAAELADTHTLEALESNVSELRARLDDYRSKYDADDPASVDAHRHATDDGTDGSMEAVWRDLTNWSSITDELRLYDRARRLRMDGSNPRTARS